MIPSPPRINFSGYAFIHQFLFISRQDNIINCSEFIDVVYAAALEEQDDIKPHLRKKNLGLIEKTVVNELATVEF